jgi:hypothetical protein
VVSVKIQANFFALGKGELRAKSGGEHRDSGKLMYCALRQHHPDGDLSCQAVYDTSGYFCDRPKFFAGQGIFEWSLVDYRFQLPPHFHFDFFISLISIFFSPHT